MTPPKQVYYILGSTGGGSQLRGPRFGEFDHVSWVTMTANGPEVAHLQLQGILAADVLSPATAPLAASLLNAAKFEGLLEVPKDGIYTFSTHSDDGSKLYIHGMEVVDNDGSHEARTRYGAVALKKGLHPVRIDYFEDFLGQLLEMGYQVPGESRERPLTGSLFLHVP